MPVRTLAENAVNMGLSEIACLMIFRGDNYFIQLSCIDNFTGECAKGLSASAVQHCPAQLFPVALTTK